MSDFEVQELKINYFYIFHSYGDVTIVGEGLQNELRAFGHQRDESLSLPGLL
jgi:hypothetical protein